MPLLAAFLLAALAQQPAIRHVWAVNDGEKVEKDDLDHPARSANSAWDGKRIRLFGARNEILAFQLIVEAGEGGIAELTAALPELKLRGGEARIVYAAPGGDPTHYAGRPIQIFSEHYLYVSEPTTASWIYRQGTPAAPADPTGWKPVQLVPENARAGRGGFPLKVEPSANQALWFDIYLARDLPPGIYEGEVRLSAGQQERRIPVELEVLAFTLPDENSLHAMVYYEPFQPERYQGRNLDPQYHRFAHRHRIELVHAYNEDSARAARGRFTGEDFTRGSGYEGPGEGNGNLLMPATFYGPGRDFDDRASAWRRSDAWMEFLRENFPKVLTFIYMPDEPSPAQYGRIRTIADNIHSNPGPGQKLPVFVTHSVTAELQGAIDVWCSPPQRYRIAQALEERAGGRDVWVYNGGRPQFPAIVIDAPATDPRAAIWACFKHGIRVYFYWHGVHWYHNQQKQGDRVQNVWANPVTFDNRGEPGKGPGAFAHGDGVLLYPGEDKLHPEEDRGIAGPVSSVQLANFRRGLQDHLYLALARGLGLDAEVAEALQAVVPRVFSDAGPSVGFSESGDDFEKARYRLARAIAAASP